MIEEQGEVDADIDVFEQSNESHVADQSLSWAILPPSDMLSVEDADQFLRWRDAAIIAVVGERNGGKTTLVTEMYGRFLRGAFADACFCHSLSLLGFEKKSFQSRAESGALSPDTPRTSAQDGLRFFHLALSNESNFQRRDLLISERAGEVYREIRDRPDRANDMIEIRKATTIAFIIDGERVAALRKRAEVFASVRDIIRALVDTGNIAKHTQIQLVATKCDLLEDSSMEDARNALSEFEQTIITMLAGRFAVVTFRTTARDPKSDSDSVSSLAPLLKSWLKPIPSIDFENPNIPELSDEFDRLLLRRMIK
ncbi:TRAFAC clade GTPase domain-containing protein [Dickeya dadantii]|uniref:TRAFAC clade GTPase domain-containing protein n=1 Tax=Dickeya dadantii TaxID=204038 RepID=UPI001C0DA005|nr:hypothetical protein [Dickeya dadantii]QWT40907.1 hypothetical protein KNV89_21795 [Dickeya dadantii]